MKKLFLHIGVTKTGTTSLQRHFFSNYCQNDGAKIAYPSTHHSEIPGHCLLAITLTGDLENLKFKSIYSADSSPSVDISKNLLRKFKACLSDIATDATKDCCIISSEEFYAIVRQNKTYDFERVILFFQKLGFDTNVVVYFRASLDHFLSDYVQNVKDGGTLEFPNYCQALGHEKVLHDYSGLELLEALYSTLSQDKIYVLPYVPGETVNSFCNLVGAKAPRTTRVKHNSQRLSNKGLSFMINLNTVFPILDGEKMSEVRQIFVGSDLYGRVERCFPDEYDWWRAYANQIRHLAKVFDDHYNNFNLEYTPKFQFDKMRSLNKSFASRMEFG